MKIPACKIVFTDAEIDIALDKIAHVLESGQMILGDYTKAFEEEYAKAHDRKYGVAVASDTAGIEILLRYYDIGKGDKVLFPANGFFGIVIPILRCGAEPVFVDMLWGQNLYADEEMVAEALDKDPSIKAVILMHTGGLVAARSREISNLCKERNVICIEDAAHAPGAKFNGEYAGSFGDASVFSLYATKPINAGEGGMILTDDENTANWAKVYRNYGRKSEFGSGVHVVEGYSWRLTEIQAVIGLGQLKRQDAIREERQKIADTYDSLVGKLENLGVYTYKPRKLTQPNHYRYLMLLPDHWTKSLKDKMREHLKENYDVDLPGDVYEMLAHEQRVWKGRFRDERFPISTEWSARHFSLPIYNTLTAEEQKYVVDSVYKSVKKIGEIADGR